MSRGLCAVMLAVILVLGMGSTTAPEAWAHGGVIRPPPSKDPGGSAPGDVPVHGDPGTGGPPITTPGGGPMGPTTPGSRRTRHRADGTVPEVLGPQEDWAFWWSLQHESLVGPSLRGGLNRRTGPASTSPGSMRLRLLRLARTRVVPALLALTDPQAGEPDDVVASALLALTRLSAETAARDRCVAWVLRRDADPMVRESAALALGLLRRTDPGLRASQGTLDQTRARLLQVFDRHVDGKRLRIPERTRIFALYALGLLGDQPFGKAAHAVDGRLITRLVWERVERGYQARELRLAPLAALGLQPQAGVPSSAVDALDRLVEGRKAAGRKWDPRERSHALTTLLRVGGPRGRARLLRTLQDPKTPLAIRLAGLLGTLDQASQWSGGERTALRRVLASRLDREDVAAFERGLTWMGLGALLDADARAKSWRGFDEGMLRRFEGALRRDETCLGGWVPLALGTAARGAGQGTEPAQAFAKRARFLLRDLLRSRTRDVSVRGAAAIASAMLSDAQTAAALGSLLTQPGTAPTLRAHAATAAGLLPSGDEVVMEALVRAFRTSEAPQVRHEVGLALARQGSTHAMPLLVGALRDPGADTGMRAAMARALGALRDLDAVEVLLETALGQRGSDKVENEEVRAMAIVALGRLLDPEPKPSLSRLLIPANYPARGDALQEALTLR